MEKLGVFSQPNSVIDFTWNKNLDIVDSGIDCSEVTEDFIANLGGRALLILSKEYNRYKMFEVTKSDGSTEEYLYHYAWLDNNKRVYDVFLGYKGIPYKEYLAKIGYNKIKEDVIVETINSKVLKAYI